MNSIGAPAFIHGGTVLGLARLCRAGLHSADDVDFALEWGWYKDNFDRIVDALLAAGFRPMFYFPGAKSFHQGHNVPVSMRETMGFETGWTSRGGLKVDLFSIVWEERANASSPSYYTWGLWAPANKFNKCKAAATGVAPYSWHNVKTSVPTPLEPLLVSLYGKDFMTPHSWRWDVEPFTIGSCVRSKRRRALLAWKRGESERGRSTEYRPENEVNG